MPPFPHSEANFRRDEEVEQKLTTFGIGMGHRFRWFERIFGARDIFEHVASYLTYHSLDEQGRGLAYSGPGLRAGFWSP